IQAGALDSLGLERRELLWQLGLLTKPIAVEAKQRRSEPRPRASGASHASTTANGQRPMAIGPHKQLAGVQAPLPLPVEQDMVELPRLSPWQQLAWDYERLGMTGRQHPMAFVRPLLHEGVISSLQLGGPYNPNRLPQGMRVE